MPDHVPKAVGNTPDPEMENFAFAFGYIRGLIQAEKHLT
jgi:mannonate dehydratase